MNRKRIGTLALAVVLVAGLAACGERTPQPPDREEQLAALAAAREQWSVEETDWWAYAVTDLDGNGLLELVSTQTQGTGMVTTTRLWEVDETGGVALCPQEGDVPLAIIPRAMPGQEGGPSAPIPAYRESDGTVHYLTDLWLRDGMNATYESKGIYTLKNGTLSGTLLAERSTEYSPDGTERVTCVNGEGEIITPEEYDGAVPQGEYTPMDCAILWLERLQPAAAGEELAQQLAVSLDAFALTQRK